MAAVSLPAVRAGLQQELLVLDAGEDDREVPDLAPGPAVEPLGCGSVTGKAGRAEPGRGDEQPGIRPRRTSAIGHGPGDRRIPVLPGRQGQRGDFPRCQPRQAGEGLGLGRCDVQQQLAGEAAVAGAVGPAGHARQVQRRETEAVSEPQQVADQGLSRDRLQAHGQRAHDRPFLRFPHWRQGRDRRARCSWGVCAWRGGTCWRPRSPARECLGPLRRPDGAGEPCRV